MTRRVSPTSDDADMKRWYRLGVLIAVANLAFLAVLVTLMAYDLRVGLAFAIVASICGGAAVMLYVLRRR